MTEKNQMHVGQPKALNWTMIGVVVALCINTGVLIFWGGGLNQRVTTLEQIVAPLSDGTLARLDERTLAISKTLERMERDRGPSDRNR